MNKRKVFLQSRILFSGLFDVFLFFCGIPCAEKDRKWANFGEDARFPSADGIAEGIVKGKMAFLFHFNMIS